MGLNGSYSNTWLRIKAAQVHEGSLSLPRTSVHQIKRTSFEKPKVMHQREAFVTVTALCRDLSPQFKASASLKTWLHRWSWRSNAGIKEASLYGAGHRFSKRSISLNKRISLFSDSTLAVVLSVETLVKDTSFVLLRRKQVSKWWAVSGGGGGTFFK